MGRQKVTGGSHTESRSVWKFLMVQLPCSICVILCFQLLMMAVAGAYRLPFWEEYEYGWLLDYAVYLLMLGVFLLGIQKTQK